MRRRTRNGFTLIELMVVVLIIGIIAAIAAGNYMNAIQRAKQKRTMADIRAVAIAWESRAVDTRQYNASGMFSMPASTYTYTQMYQLLTPTYLANIPQTDGWNFPLDFAADQALGAARAASTYAIRSPGRDGKYLSGPYTEGPTTEFDCDIVYSGGQFLVWPEGIQQK